MRKQLIFYINDTRHAVDNEFAFMSLAEYLRDRCRLVGTKVVCNEGDCGACSALVGRRVPDSNRLHYETIDSCIAYLFQLDQTHIVTIEGLGRPENLSSVQSAMVQCHGSQCGFCTPGFVAAMHGMIENEKPFDDENLRYELSGNLCRCTGYSAIIEAGLQINVDKCSKVADRFPAAPIIADFNSLSNLSIEIPTSLGRVFVAKSLSEAVAFRAKFPKATIVNGATDYGVLRNHGKLSSGIRCA